MQRLTLRLLRLTCLDETDEPPGFEWGTDTMLLGGLATDATGDVRQFATHKWAGLEDNDFVEPPQPLVLAAFNFADDDTMGGKVVGWPRSYFVTFALAEQDNGGFPDWMTKLYTNLRDWAVKKIAEYAGDFFAGEIGAAIGKVIGEIVGWVFDQLFNALVDWWDDDIFLPFTARCELPSPHHTFNDDGPSNAPRWVEWTGHGGQYRLDYDWHLEGVPSTVGIYATGSGGYALWRSNWPNFVAKWGELSTAGLRLVDVGTYVDGDTRMYVGVFRAGTGGFYLYDLAWASFEAKRAELHNAGYRLISFDTYMVGTELRSVGAFRPGGGREQIARGDWATFQAAWQSWSNAGLRLTDITTYHSGGRRTFVGVFHDGTDGHGLWVSDWASFVAKWRDFAGTGLLLTNVSTYQDGATRMYAGVFRAGSASQYMWRAANWRDFDQVWTTQSGAGRRLVSLGV